VARLITYLDLASIFKIQKIRFRLQVESYISDWLFGKSRLLASYVSRHNAMAYDRVGQDSCYRSLYVIECSLKDLIPDIGHTVVPLNWLLWSDHT
jgi:hypothetical protein